MDFQIWECLDHSASKKEAEAWDLGMKLEVRMLIMVHSLEVFIQTVFECLANDIVTAAYRVLVYSSYSQ
jgi:hypothetical protein